MYKRLLFLVFVRLTIVTNAQVSLDWAKSIGGINGETVYSISFDALGNVYTVGYFSGTVDFDPGVGTFNLVSNDNNQDVYISKLDPSGNFVWAKNIGGPTSNYNYGKSIDVDQDGNVYVTGIFESMVDFDPGVGIFNLTASGGSDIFVLKLDVNGDFVWAINLGGSTTDYGNSILVDSLGNVYLTGGFRETADFDPGIGVYNLTATGPFANSLDIFILKLDVNGNFIWVKQFGGADDGEGNYTTIDDFGNIYTSGKFKGTFDFDPGADSFNMTAAGNGSYFISKLDANGNFVWAKKMLVNSTTSQPISHDIDPYGNVYITGQYNGVFDFDPGPDTLYLANQGGGDIFLCKLDSSGNFVWAKNMSGSEHEGANKIYLDDFGFIYLTGAFKGVVDFNPGVEEFNLTSNPLNEYNAFISKLDGDGNFIWVKQIGGTSAVKGHTLAVDITGNIYVAGIFVGTGYFDLGNGVINLSSNGTEDVFTIKLNQKDVLGYVYHDINENCIQNINENAQQGKSIIINPGNILVKTNALGFWLLDSLPSGSYTVSYIMDTNWVTTCVTQQNFLITNLDSFTIAPSIGLKAKFGFAKGLMYHDINENCIKDTNELGKPSVMGIVNPGNVTVYSDSLGLWVTDTLSVGNYTLTIDSTTTWRASCIDSLYFEVLPYGTLDTMSLIGLKSVIPCPAPTISVNMSNLFRCFNNQKMYVQACNTNYGSDSIINAYVELQLDTLLTPTTTSSSDVSFTPIGNNTYQFDIGTLKPGECVDFWLDVDVSCDAVLGQTLCMQANLYPVDSCVLDTVPAIQTGEVSLCSSPWDNSSLTVDGWCQNDSIYFIVTNMGDFGSGDMQCYSPVRIFIDGVYTILDSVLLTGGETQQFIFSGDGRTWRMEADQHPLHPGHSYPNATVERCGDSTNWTPNLVNILPMNDADPIVDIYCGVVTGSYDPNDKTGYPLGVGTDHIVAPNGKLDYVIRFQNTGTAPAVTVVIRDTLDVDLDIFSVQSGVSSHDYTFTMYGPRVLEWTFNNIMLPDSISDPEGSKGFVTFTVNQVPDLAIGTEINNSVGIYFDFNEPVITNTTSHIIGVFDNLPVGIKKEIIANEVLTIYPNPTGNTLNVILVDNKPVQFYIYSIDGKLVESMTIRGNTSLDVSTYNSGMYFIKAINSDGKIFQSKFVKE